MRKLTALKFKLEILLKDIIHYNSVLQLPIKTADSKMYIILQSASPYNTSPRAKPRRECCLPPKDNVTRRSLNNGFALLFIKCPHICIYVSFGEPERHIIANNDLTYRRQCIFRSQTGKWIMVKESKNTIQTHFQSENTTFEAPIQMVWEWH